MRGHEQQDDGLKAFISARTQDLHRGAYQLTASQDAAERLVVAVLTDLQRDRLDLSRADAVAQLRMAQLAARNDTPTATAEEAQVPERFRPLIRLSPRQRAVLVLRVIAGYDDRAIGRALHLSSRMTTETLHSIPYDELPGTTDQSGELRSLLEDFGDLGTAPSASTTIHDIHAAPRAPRRPWWTYAAALLVIALTATCVVVTQGWHKEWLQTPDGLNHTHGTHFPAYTQGYKLVDILDVTPGIAQDVTTGKAGAVALPCGATAKGIRLSVQSAADGGYAQDSCPLSGSGPRLTRVVGRASAIVLGGAKDYYPIGIYKEIPRNEYPVATDDFDVQHSLKLSTVRKEAAGGRTPSTAAKSVVLTLRGTAAHHNGTFTGKLRLPRAETDLDAQPVQAVGLLSPTTTGRFRLQIGGIPARTNCGEDLPLTDDHYRGCSLLDHRVPQVQYRRDVSTESGTAQVELVVEGTRGPWTLQVVADTYEIGAGSSD